MLSPDGSKLVYRADQDFPDVVELYSVPITGGGSTKLSAPMVSGGDIETSAFWVSADGTIVVYVADQEVDGREELYSVPIGGGPVTKLNGPLLSQDDVEDVTVSPSSPYVVFGAYHADRLEDDLYSVPVGGGPYTLIADEYTAPKISPDGTFVVDLTDPACVPIPCDPGGEVGEELYRVSITGGPVIKLNPPLVPEKRVYGNPNIAPDGSTVMFVTGDVSPIDPDFLFVSDVDPAGTDTDGDGFGGACDCDDTGPDVWDLPGEVRNLVLSHESSTALTTMSWEAPEFAGTLDALLTYDTLRTETGDDFVSEPPALCLESNDGSDTTSVDESTPPTGTGFHYLVAARSGCGRGLFGYGSDGTPRQGLDCP